MPTVARSRYRLSVATLTVATLTVAALLILSACSSAPQQTSTPMPTLPPFATGPAATQPAAPTASAPAAAPDSPTTTSAIALDKPKRGSNAPEGAVVFGTDFTVGAKSIGLIGEKTTFATGHPVAWRVTLPAATGGESVRVTLTTEDGTETLVDTFVAQPGWNVYYGKSLLTVAPGTYVLHYFVDGHEMGSGTFKIKTADSPSAVPTATPTATPTPAPTTTPTVDPLIR